MKHLILIVCFCAAVVLFGIAAGVVFVAAGPARAQVYSEPDQVLARAAPNVAAPVLLSSPDAAHRTPVPTVTDDDLERAIAEADATRAQYEQLIATDSYSAMLLRMEEAEGRANVLKGHVAHLERELARAALDPSTPYGHFALLAEVADADAVGLRAVQSWLELFPVMLEPHEAEWLLERQAAKDWRDWPGHGSTETVIAYLNPARLKAELPPEIMAGLVARYADEPWVFPE